MKKTSLLFIAMALSTILFAQKPVIAFDITSHDFGKIEEEEGKATIVFNFTNKGNAPMVVSRVQASCGCTTPTWTKEPIEPGRKGSITVTYNPVGRPGAFSKSIAVYSNASEEQVNLMIRGEVIPKVTSDNESMPLTMGDLRLKNKIVQMNNIEKGKSQVRVLEIQNGTNNDVRTTIESLPSYITAVVTPDVLKPKAEGKITFTLNTKVCPTWGPLADDVYVVLNGQRKYNDEYKVTLYSNIIEDFSKLTPDQKRKAPILEVPTRTIEVGVIKKGSKKNLKYRISNKGINPLEIRRIVNNNREIALHQPRLTVAGGKSAFISMDIDSKNLPEGDYKKTLTIQTNDPDNSFIIAILNWKVQK